MLWRLGIACLVLLLLVAFMDNLQRGGAHDSGLIAGLAIIARIGAFLTQAGFAATVMVAIYQRVHSSATKN